VWGGIREGVRYQNLPLLLEKEKRKEKYYFLESVTGWAVRECKGKGKIY
jgi:hypothetical protein